MKTDDQRTSWPSWLRAEVCLSSAGQDSDTVTDSGDTVTDSDSLAPLINPGVRMFSREHHDFWALHLETNFEENWNPWSQKFFPPLNFNKGHAIFFIVSIFLYQLLILLALQMQWLWTPVCLFPEMTMQSAYFHKSLLIVILNLRSCPYNGMFLV